MTLNLLLRIPLCIIPLIRAVYLAFRDPDKRASDRVAKLLLASKTPRYYWKRDAAFAAVFIFTTIPNINSVWTFLTQAPVWLHFVFSIGYVVIVVGSAIYWLNFDRWHPIK